MRRIIFFFILVSLCSCDVMDSKKLHVINETNDTLLCFIDINNSFLTGNNPLNSSITRINKEEIVLNNNLNYLLYPNSQSDFSSYNWEKSYEKGVYLNLYLARDLITKDTVFSDTVKPSKTLRFSLSQLEKLNWEIHLTDNHK